MKELEEILHSKGYIKTHKTNLPDKELSLNEFRKTLKKKLGEVLNKEFSKHSKKIHLINAPAGTGKTKILYEMICDL